MFLFLVFLFFCTVRIGSAVLKAARQETMLELDTTRRKRCWMHLEQHTHTQRAHTPTSAREAEEGATSAVMMAT